MQRRASSVSSPSLYKSEGEIARLVLGESAQGWSSLAIIWEREGLPRIDPMTGMRFWPAVESFLLRRHGLITSLIPAQADGVETW